MLTKLLDKLRANQSGTADYYDFHDGPFVPSVTGISSSYPKLRSNYRLRLARSTRGGLCSKWRKALELLHSRPSHLLGGFLALWPACDIVRRDVTMQDPKRAGIVSIVAALLAPS